jgi:signal peptidase
LKVAKDPIKALEMVKYKPITILTGSMKPTFKPGDLIIVKDVLAENIKEGDIITYKLSNDLLATHRVCKVKNENSRLSFITKGDANNSADENEVLPDKLLGKYVFKIRNGGFIARLLRTKMGFIITVCIPIIMIIITEIKNLYK